MRKRDMNEKKIENLSVPRKAFNLSLIAGILIAINAVGLGFAATWFPWVIPTLPGSNGNAAVPFVTLTVVGLICGLVVLFGALMLHNNPANRRIWGLAILLFSLPSVIMGGGFIIGFILGIISGVYAIPLATNTQKRS
jgi:hypothetical protein